MTTVEESAMLELLVNPTYVVEVFVQQIAVLETSTFVVAQITLLSTEQKSLPMGNFVSKMQQNQGLVVKVYHHAEEMH